MQGSIGVKNARTFSIDTSELPKSTHASSALCFLDNRLLFLGEHLGFLAIVGRRHACGLMACRGEDFNCVRVTFVCAGWLWDSPISWEANCALLPGWERSLFCGEAGRTRLEADSEIRRKKEMIAHTQEGKMIIKKKLPVSFASQDSCYESDITNIQSGLMIPHQADATGLQSGAAEVLHMPTSFRAAFGTFLKGRQKNHAAKVKMTAILRLGLKYVIKLQIIIIIIIIIIITITIISYWSQLHTYLYQLWAPQVHLLESLCSCTLLRNNSDVVYIELKLKWEKDAAVIWSLCLENLTTAKPELSLFFFFF